MRAYPIKFSPILKEKIWGGDKLAKIYNKNSTSTSIGESWEISGVEHNISVVSNGIYKGKSLQDLIKQFSYEFLGTDNIRKFGENFPLLIKYLDAKTNLSVQVHPDDEMAGVYHDSYGKTEMWYIMESENNAEIILGLKDQNLNRNKLSDVNASNVKQIFNSVKVNKGESYFIPAGEVHAIGAGVVVAEIQQTSDITYRVYDWDRTDDHGNKRELHTELAAKATKVFNSNSKVKHTLSQGESNTLVSCNYFTTNKFNIKGEIVKDYSNLDSFVIFMCVEGVAEVTINGVTELISIGETVLLPANCKDVNLNSQDANFLEVYIDSKNTNQNRVAS
jgi:mannose-6-phosphate isomerase